MTLEWDYHTHTTLDGILFSLLTGTASTDILIYDAAQDIWEKLNGFNASFTLPATLTVDNLPNDFSGELPCRLFTDSTVYSDAVNMILCASEGESKYI